MNDIVKPTIERHNNNTLFLAKLPITFLLFSSLAHCMRYFLMDLLFFQIHAHRGRAVLGSYQPWTC